MFSVCPPDLGTCKNINVCGTIYLRYSSLHILRWRVAYFGHVRSHLAEAAQEEVTQGEQIGIPLATKEVAAVLWFECPGSYRA